MKISYLCGVLLVALLSSCVKHENVYTGEGDSGKKKEEYDKNFPVKDIDPEQNWNMAKQFIVNVTVNYGGGSEYTIKIYSDNPRDPEVQAYLLGKYTVKSGSANALKVDAVASLKSVYVCCVDATGGSVMRKGTVEAGKTSVVFGTVAGRSVSGRAETEWQEFGTKEIANLVGKDGTFEEASIPKNSDIVMTSYEFLSKGEFTIYAVFGETGGTDDIGYYYYNVDEGIEKKIERSLINIPQKEADSFLKYWGTNKGKDYEWLLWDFPPFGTGYSHADWIQGGVEKISSRPLHIDAPSGSKVGFYVKNTGSVHYSNSALNIKGEKYSAVIYKDGTVPQYIGLEDGDDGDCNDIIFYIKQDENTTPDVVDPEEPEKPEKPQTWTIACEDLGSIGDYDFNDVVFGISYINGESEATLTPYAAGGTLAANIYWDTQNLGEIHGLLQPGASITTMINTNSKGEPGTAKTINVDKNFSMTTNMGGFTVKVGDKDGTMIVSPKEGEAPQMICVSGEWVWPKERTNIINAYSGFKDWAQDHTTNTDWWEKSNPGTVVQ